MSPELLLYVILHYYKYYKEVNSKRNNKAEIQFENAVIANEYIENEIFNGKKFKIYIPSRLVTCGGVIVKEWILIINRYIINYFNVLFSKLATTIN